MYLHIGENHLIPFENIIYILSIKDALKNKNEFFIQNIKKEEKLLDCTENLKARSIVGCKDGKVYISPINSHTLKKRFEEFLNYC